MNNRKAKTDAEILELLLPAIEENYHSLSENLGYKSPNTIYHIKNGVNKMSYEFINKILEKYPRVRKEFLKYGETPVLGPAKTENPSLDVFSKFLEVPERLENIERMLEELLSKK